MPLVYARKVNQQCQYLQKLLELSKDTHAACAGAILQAGYLQFELALRFYVQELAGETELEFVTPEVLAEVAAEQPAAELLELRNLAASPESWLGRVLCQLKGLRAGEQPGRLKGSIFSLHEDPEDSLIAVQDVSSAPSDANLQDLEFALASFKQMLERQRDVRSEY